MPPNIYIIGTQCTGKTTLVNALEKSFSKSEEGTPGTSSPRIIREVARTVMKQHNIRREDLVSSHEKAIELQGLIIAHQDEAEQEMQRQGQWYLSDRSAFDATVYAEIFVGPDAAADLLRSSDHWARCKERMWKSVVFLCEAGYNWLEDDGVRVMPGPGEGEGEGVNEWKKWHALFVQRLEEQDIEFYLIPASMKDLDERVKTVQQLWMRADVKMEEDARMIEG